jgi:hypothetical protein
MKIENLLQLRPERFRFLRRFVVSKQPRSGAGFSCSVEVTLAEDLTFSRSLQITFFDATDIHIGDVNGTVASLLTIYDIADRGLEDTHYRAVDEESRYFALHCRDFQFSIMEP